MSYHSLDVAAFELVLVPMKKFTHCSSKSHPKSQITHYSSPSLNHFLPTSRKPFAATAIFSVVVRIILAIARSPSFPSPRTRSRIRPTFRPIGGPRRESPPSEDSTETETETERVTSGIIVAQIAADGGDDALASSLARRAELRGAE